MWQPIGLEIFAVLGLSATTIHNLVLLLEADIFFVQTYCNIVLQDKGKFVSKSKNVSTMANTQGLKCEDGKRVLPLDA